MHTSPVDWGPYLSCAHTLSISDGVPTHTAERQEGRPYDRLSFTLNTDHIIHTTHRPNIIHTTHQQYGAVQARVERAQPAPIAVPLGQMLDRLHRHLRRLGGLLGRHHAVQAQERLRATEQWRGVGGVFEPDNFLQISVGGCGWCDTRKRRG